MLLLVTNTSSLWQQVDNVNFVTAYAHTQPFPLQSQGRISLLLALGEEGSWLCHGDNLAEKKKKACFLPCLHQALMHIL